MRGLLDKTNNNTQRDTIMTNPFTYTKQPATTKQAQANVNYWYFEGMQTSEELEEQGILPAAFNTYITEMKRSAQADLVKHKGV